MNISGRNPIRALVRVAAAIVLAFATLTCAAQQVMVAGAWARATVPGQKTAAAYVTLTAVSDAFLVAAASPVADKVEIHHMSVEGGIMRMRPVRRLELPAGRMVRFAPGDLHLMLIGVSRQLNVGDRMPLVLSIETSRGETTQLKVEAEVRAAGATGSPHH